MKGLKLRRVIVTLLASVGVTSDDDEGIRLQKTILIVTTVIISVMAVVWGLFYLSLDQPLAASIPLSYSLISFVNLILLRRKLDFPFFRTSQLLLFLLLPFFLTLVLGGFVNSSAVILWALLAPLGALLGGQSRQAMYWFLPYVALVLISGFVDSFLRPKILDENVITFFFVLNIGAVSSVAFFLLNYFVKQKDLLIEVMQKNRELEEAYLQQEIMLRHNEKLATLGKLSAGVAHELNNPAAAAQRAATHLQSTLLELEQAEFGLRQLNLSPAQLKVLESHIQLIYERARQPTFLDPLTRSDQEYEIENWLEDKGVGEAWEFAPALVNIGYGSPELSSLANHFAGEQFTGVVALLSHIYTTRNLLEEIGQGTGRMVEIVKALKSYSYLDQAPRQLINVHEGLNDTLVILRSKLKDGIEVRRDYALKLRDIEAFGSELNQVWTNIIDNAIGAMAGQGTLVLKTYQEDEWIVVEITDTGPGIPPEVQKNIFDPFVTTKPPGEGTGLGLNISHHIIVQKHKGQISVTSKPGQTCFQVKLPIHFDNNL
ncbi:sensor histidine kinase [Candidatus Leptofilum sp.]|uniref:sensor histidine kinase n=1 Tax=Candidatus Leptofilum sp. TaxID=3241576 RepID=UPI003B58E27D